MAPFAIVLFQSARHDPQAVLDNLHYHLMLIAAQPDAKLPVQHPIQDRFLQMAALTTDNQIHVLVLICQPVV
jgi:hypothetical protein